MEGSSPASLGYRLTPDWSVYSSYYYFNNSTGSQSLLGPRQVMAAGIRWAWAPAYKLVDEPRNNLCFDYSDNTFRLKA